MMKQVRTFNEEQLTALEQIVEWLQDPDADWCFLLEGYAGTGKTYTIEGLIELAKGRLIFTAPTNKATKVLRDTLTSDEYKPECRTIYSLLGLTLEANGEIKELAAPEDPLDLSHYKAVVVDEASMVNSKLFKFIQQTAEDSKVKFIFMGDPAQLPPVGELRSPVWQINENHAKLFKVMRHDNQILEFVTRLRQVVDHPAPTCKIVSNNADGEGVWKLGEGEFEQRLLDAASLGHFSIPNHSKAIGWRNVTVDRLNRVIRGRIFPGEENLWRAEDRVTLLGPAKDLSGQTCGTTDDEGTVTRVEVDYHPVYESMKTWRLTITTDDNRIVVWRSLHADSLFEYNRKVEELAAAAKLNRRLWGMFWKFKEAFHPTRHAYATTAHRAQGSTYVAAYVDYRDILLNRNRQEAYRCLYVAASRPKKSLYLA
jgi:exodeoxyribonuclease-5